MSMTNPNNQVKNLWQRMDGPLKVGLSFALLGIILTIIGIFRDPTTPVTAWSLLVGSAISGGVWGLVSWAIATAAVEVEHDVSQAEAVLQEEIDAAKPDTEEDKPGADEPA